MKGIQGLFTPGSLQLPQAAGPTSSLPTAYPGRVGASCDIALASASSMSHLLAHSDRRSLGHLSASQLLAGNLLGAIPGVAPAAAWALGRGQPMPTAQPMSARSTLGPALVQPPPRLTSAPLGPNGPSSPPCPTPRMTSGASAAATIVAVATAMAGQAAVNSPIKTSTGLTSDSPGEWKSGKGKTGRSASAGVDRRRRFLV